VNPSDVWLLPPWYWRWLTDPRAHLVFAWLLCLGVAGQRLHHARTVFDNHPDAPVEEWRADGNSGHAEVDFGGQWVMGRMVVTGHADELYHRNRQWEVVRQGYPRELESPHQHRNAFPTHLRPPVPNDPEPFHDDERMMHWFMGKDAERWQEVGPTVGLLVAADGIVPNPFAAAALALASRERMTPELAEAVTKPAVGGPLYPPIHAFYYAPIGLDPSPRRAYRTFQVVSVLLTFLAGLGVSRISRGRIWWPVATLLILLYPGYRPGLDLAQNHILSLTIVVWGWALAARGRDGLGGMVWGLLAFKPVWAAAFFLAPLLMGRWRFCGAMVATGAALAVATLPFVGLHSWDEWRQVGKEANDLYQVNRNWTFLGRDLAGIARRGLIDFKLPDDERGNLAADVGGWAVWGAVFVPTVGLYLWRGDKRYRTGLGAGFLFLGSYLCCYRFMYYDALLSALPLAVLFADPGRFLRPTAVVVGGPVRWTGYVNSAPLTLVVLLYLVENWLLQLGLEGTARLGFLDPGEKPAPSVSGELSLYYPIDTFVLIGIWAWAGVRLLIGGDWGEPPLRSESTKGVEGGADVR
jgi:hypothetical protein